MKLLFCFRHVGPRNWTEIIGSRCKCPFLLNHFSSHLYDVSRVGKIIDTKNRIEATVGQQKRKFFNESKVSIWDKEKHFKCPVRYLMALKCVLKISENCRVYIRYIFTTIENLKNSAQIIKLWQGRVSRCRWRRSWFSMKGIEPRVNRSCDPLGLGGKYLGNKTIER